MVAEARVTTPIPQRARASLFAILQPIALATDLDDVPVMQKPIPERCSEYGIRLRCGGQLGEIQASPFLWKPVLLADKLDLIRPDAPARRFYIDSACRQSERYDYDVKNCNTSPNR